MQDKKNMNMSTILTWNLTLLQSTLTLHSPSHSVSSATHYFSSNYQQIAVMVNDSPFAVPLYQWFLLLLHVIL